LLRPVIWRSDWHFDWQPSADLLARGVDWPLIGPELQALIGREQPADLAIVMVPARDLAIRDLACLGYGPGDLFPLAWAADAAEAVGYARGFLLAGDVTSASETTVIVGPAKADIDGWRADRVGPFIGQARAFSAEVDPVRPRRTTDDPRSWDSSFMDLSGVKVGRDAWADRDLVGEDLARWRCSSAA